MASSSSSAAKPGALFGGIADPGARAVVEAIFGKERGKQLAWIVGKGKKHDWRAVLETKDAVTQCNNAVGGLDAEGNKICYLCNQMIPEKEGRSPNHPLFAECEHVLPVTTARWYLALYTDKSDTKDPATKEMFTMEYAWAHRICNQTKSNNVFIYENKTGEVVPFTDVIQNTLNTIKDRAEKYQTKKETKKFITKIDEPIVKGIADMKVDLQVKRIVTTKITPIIERMKVYNPEDTNLLTLSRVALLTDTKYLSDDAKKFLDEKYKGKIAEIDPAIESTKQTFKAYRDVEIMNKTYNYIEAALPKFGDTPLDMLLMPLASYGITPRTYLKEVPGGQAAFQSKLMTELAKFREDFLARIAKFLSPSKGGPPNVSDTDFDHFIDLYYCAMYTFFLKFTVASRGLAWMKNRKAFTCHTLNMQRVFLMNSQKSELIKALIASDFPDLTKPVLDASLLTGCAEYEESRRADEERLKKVLDAMSEDEWQAYIHEEDDKQQTYEEYDVQLRNEIRQVHEDEAFLEAEPETIQTHFRINSLYQDLEELKTDRIELSTKEGIAKRIADLRAEAAVWASTDKSRVDAIQQQVNELETNPDAVRAMTEKRYATTLAEFTREVERLSELKAADALSALGDYDLQLAASRLQALRTTGGKRVKHAKTFRRTKGGRRSGPSTLSRRRSFRKRQTGKATKRTRY